MLANGDYDRHDTESQGGITVTIMFILILAAICLALLATFLNDPQGRSFVQMFFS